MTRSSKSITKNVNVNIGLSLQYANWSYKLQGRLMVLIYYAKFIRCFCLYSYLCICFMFIVHVARTIDVHAAKTNGVSQEIQQKSPIIVGISKSQSNIGPI